MTFDSTSEMLDCFRRHRFYSFSCFSYSTNFVHPITHSSYLPAATQQNQSFLLLISKALAFCCFCFCLRSLKRCWTHSSEREPLLGSIDGAGPPPAEPPLRRENLILLGYSPMISEVYLGGRGIHDWPGRSSSRPRASASSRFSPICNCFDCIP